MLAHINPSIFILWVPFILLALLSASVWGPLTSPVKAQTTLNGAVAAPRKLVGVFGSVTLMIWTIESSTLAVIAKWYGQSGERKYTATPGNQMYFITIYCNGQGWYWRTDKGECNNSLRVIAPTYRSSVGKRGSAGGC